MPVAGTSEDEDEFRRLYDETARVVHGVLLAHVSPAVADDLSQDVYLAAWRERAKLPGVEAPAAWLCAIARHLALKFLRRSGVRREQAESELETTELEDQRSGLQAEARGDSRDRGAMILRAIQALPEPYNELLGMRLVEGLTGPELANTTGRSHGTIRVQLARGLELLRERLQREGLT